MEVQTISSQGEIIEEIVEEKIEAQDFEVQVSPTFEVNGKKYRVVLDGHHSLEAAQRCEATPEFEEIRCDACDMLDAGDIDGFLEAIYIDCSYYDVYTQKTIF